MSSIQLPAKIENMELLVQFISDIARKLGFSGKRVKEIELATEEALVNIINYAYPDHSGDIKVTCTQDPSKALVIKIEDTGIAFDISSLKDPDISAGISDREVGGLGVFLIRKLMDKVRYHRKNKKNILELVIHIPTK
ncbi:MAG: ATP-binding protein [Deltaproteobacteria bacterium]|nr:ATP-binding protein [Deltaproteobacteria bacterium]